MSDLRTLRKVAAVYEHEFRDIDTARALRRVADRLEKVTAILGPFRYIASERDDDWEGEDLVDIEIIRQIRKWLKGA